MTTIKKVLLTSLFTSAVSQAQSVTLVSYDFGDTLAADLSGTNFAGVTSTDVIGSETNGGGTRTTTSAGNSNTFGHTTASVGTIAGTLAGDLTTETSGTTDRSLTVTGGNADINGSAVADLATALANEIYLEFSVDAGINSIDLDTLSFLSSRNHAARALDIFGLYVSTDNFANTPVEADAIIALNGTTAGEFNEFNFDLSSINASADELTFRIYLAGRTATSTNSAATNFDNFVLTGEVSNIPEPASTALLGLGGIALLLRRRK